MAMVSTHFLLVMYGRMSLITPSPASQKACSSCAQVLGIALITNQHYQIIK
jgi:hypothetical protein